MPQVPLPEAQPDDLDEEPDELDEGFEEVQFAGTASVSDPHTFKQAMRGDDSEHWKDAANAEINTLMQNGTWELVDLPPGAKAIGSGWVFKVKRKADGSIEPLGIHIPSTLFGC